MGRARSSRARRLPLIQYAMTDRIRFRASARLGLGVKIRLAALLILAALAAASLLG